MVATALSEAAAAAFAGGLAEDGGRGGGGGESRGGPKSALSVRPSSFEAGGIKRASFSPPRGLRTWLAVVRCVRERE